MSPRLLDLSGQRFGMLTAVTRLPEKEDRSYLWECKCDCGGAARVSTKKLKRGTITNCGCIPKKTVRRGTIAEDITGQRFGLLVAIKKDTSRKNRTHWLCRCDCGNTRITTTNKLKDGRVWNCGCKSESKMLDLKGRRFGRLTAVSPTDGRTIRGSVIWECICDCGTTVTVPCERLVNGNTTSCGCRKKEVNASINGHLTFVDGTCIEWLRVRKHRADNTSGFRGVNKTPNGKWKVGIGFKRKRYYFGTYETFEEAKEVRLEIEKKLHDGFVVAWEKWSNAADDNPEWGANNPFIFDFVKDDRDLHVYAPALSELT